jgi:hypothetical protein
MAIDPVSIGLMAGGGLASILGGGMNRRAERHYTDMNLLADMQQIRQDLETAKLRNQVLDEYRGNAREFATENQGNFTGGLGAFFPDAQQTALTGAADGRNATIQQAIGTPSAAPAVPLRESTPDAIKSLFSAGIGDAFSRASQQGTAMSKVGAYGDVDRGNASTIAGMGSQIGTVNNLARGNAALLPAEQDLFSFKANKPIFRPSGPAYSPWGSVLQGAGNLAVAAGAQGLGKAFSMPGASTVPWAATGGGYGAGGVY